MPPLTLSSLCEDVLLIIISHLTPTQSSPAPLKNLSLASRRFRFLVIPILFRTISINKPISQLNPTPLLCIHPRTLKIDMFGSLWWWCSGSYTSSSDALDIFRTIKSCPNLESLEISMMSRSVDIFTTAFQQPPNTTHANDTFILSTIQSLTVTSPATFLLHHCPNLQSLKIHDEPDFLLETYTPLPVRLLPLHPGLKSPPPVLTYFDASAHWSTHELTHLTTTFPSLTHLTMRTETYCYRASTPVILSILSISLPRLHTLHLVHIANLNMGYEGFWKQRIASCRDEDVRKKLGEELERRRRECEDGVVRGAFEGCEGLRVVGVGGRVARRYKGDGEEGMGWIWERGEEDEGK